MNLISAIILVGVAFATTVENAKFSTPPFRRHEVFKLPKNAIVEEVTYGNTHYGKFRISPTSPGPGRLEIDFLPPGYNYPLEFTALLKDGRVLSLGSRKLESPIAYSRLISGVKLQGKIASPFFALTLAMPKHAGKPEPIFLPAIINNEGETVWVQKFALADTPLNRAPILEPAGQGQLAIMPHRELGWLGIMDIKSGELVRVHTDSSRVFHHSLQLIPETSEAVLLTYECKSLPRSEEFLPIFQGWTNWIHYLTLPRRTYAGSKVLRINLFTGDTRAVWRTFDQFHPSRDRSLSIYNPRDDFPFVKTAAQYRSLLELPEFMTGDGGMDCLIDWSHENSARYYPGKGYLISQRNFNRLLLVGEDGKIIWSVGPEAKDTFRTSGDSLFYGQHDPWLLPDGRILLHDNGVSTLDQSNAEFQLPSRLLILKLSGNQAIAGWTFPLSEHSTKARGSVSILPDGNFLAYNPGRSEEALRLLEVDPKKSKAVAELLIKLPIPAKSIQVRPIMALGTERWIPSDPSPTEIRNLTNWRKGKLSSNDLDELANRAAEGY